ncbi:hypothetical protein KDW_50910 [Dictyobacter vulcani]|uniref:Circadian input-output histidine kinase CikA n=1 Tax=Dictyobacter vulcani TaxID=2607529 RepID=A0A5J4KXS7_9CHLR|nr:ATP-binding protein [Dictyobacter vulcani]GER90929.1 hypothetical protein KDW_50910 [Dictyobacter vulcani]
MSDILWLKASPGAQRSLITQLQRQLFLSLLLFLIFLLLSSGAGIYVSSHQQALGEQKVALHDNVNGLLQSMVDQETGLRGYIATGNPVFLEPFYNGQKNYANYLQNLKNITSSIDFDNTANALLHAQERSTAWTLLYANPQLLNVKEGNLAAARSKDKNAQGKALFDEIRKAVTSLQSSSDTDLTALQNRDNLWSGFFLGTLFLLILAVIIFLWSSFRSFMLVWRAQLANLKEATTAFGNGDFTTRVKDSKDSELNEVGHTFNKMAEELQEQQLALKDRDILEQVMQLNIVLTESLDLSELMQHFFQRMLSLLDIQVAALYLCDEDQQQLTLFSSRGLPATSRQSSFAMGEGLVGQVAQNREPMLLSRQQQGTSIFSVKTVLGEVIPSTLYHLPLIQGNELLGVLVVGSVFAMNERARNVIQVVVSNLAAAIRNTQTYEHTQQQAHTLADYAHQQELSNHALRQQRDELTVLNAALEEANRVRSQFLSTMSHELRTPLASIIGFSQMIMRSTKKSPLSLRQNENVDRILKNAQHLLILINDVLDLAKIEAGRMDVTAIEVDLPELITSVVDETRSIAVDRKLDLTVSIQDGITSIETDPRKVRQILLNLVSNALKFTETGSVSVTAVRQPLINEHNAALEQIAISVVDTGIGISAEKQEHIFDAFYQVDNTNSRVYGGTGLGLSIVRELTTLLGGKVEIRSKEGVGSTFTVFLPVHLRDQRFVQEVRLNTLRGQAISSLSEVANEVARAANTATLGEEDNVDLPDEDEYLVVAVDDNPDVLQLIAASLEQTPYRVVGVQDSTRAVKVIQKLRPKAITLDIMMPKVNGWQILHQLKSNPVTASIPVILLTVLEDRSAGYVLGADEYLVKPVERDALIDVLQQLTNREYAVVVEEANTPISGEDPAPQTINVDSSVQQDDFGAMKPILLVHTEPDIHQLVEKLKDKTGYVIQKSSDGQDILHVIEKVRPDMLMMLVHADDSKFLGDHIKSVVEQTTVIPPPVQQIEDEQHLT